MKQLTFLKSFFLLCALIVGSVNVWAIDRTVTFTFDSNWSDAITGTSWTNQYVLHRTTATSTDGSTVIYAGGKFAKQSNKLAIRYGASYGGEMFGNINPSYDNTDAKTWKTNIPASAVGAIPGKIKQIKVTTSNNRGVYILAGTSQIVGDSQDPTKTDFYTVKSAKLTTSGDNTVDYDTDNTAYTYFAVLGGGSSYTGISQIVVTYVAEAQYTITPKSNNETYGTVSLNGTTITASPESGYQVSKSTPYTINSGTATVTQDGNNFEVDASSDCTITINFEEIPSYTVTLNDNGATLTEDSPEAGVILPSRDDNAYYDFAGWSETELTEETTEADIINVGTYYPTNNITLYPVYTRTGKGRVNKYLQITSLANVTAGTYVWVSQKTTSSGQPLVYLPNTEASGSAPSLVKDVITTETTDGKTYLTNAVTNVMLWDFTATGTANKYKIRPHGNTSIGLGHTSSTGDNIRISSTYKDYGWTISENNDHNWDFKSDATNSMYLAVYDATKWRNYGNNTTNQNGDFYLYKQVKEVDNINYYVSQLTTTTVTLANACTDGKGNYYGTYSNTLSFVVPNDMNVSEIGIDGDGKLNVQAYTTGEVVPANTGVMLSSSSYDSHTIVISGAEGTSVLGSDNRLRSTGSGITAETMAAADASCKFYRLTMHGYVENVNPGVIGFYWGATDGASFAIAANKAYLAVPEAQAARMSGFALDNTATGINGVEEIAPVTKTRKVVKNGRLVIETANGEFTIDGARMK